MITPKLSPPYVHSQKYMYSDAFCFTNTYIMYDTIFQSLLVQGITKNVKINRQKVLSAVIRSSGAVINVRNMVKNIRKITTQTVKGKKYYYEMCHLHALIIGKW